MKVKTSVTLSSELLRAISAEANTQSRSEFIETAVWDYLATRRRTLRDERELAIINANSAELNREADEATGFQDGP